MSFPRSWALSRLRTENIASHRAFRSARLGGVLVAFTTVIGIIYLATEGAADATDLLAFRSLAYGSWLFGIFGVWALGDPRRGLSGSEHLARLRGYAPDEMRGTVNLGAAARLARGVFIAGGVPMVFSVFLSSSPAMALVRLGSLISVALYCVALGASLVALTHFAREFTPKSPRLTVAAVVLLPFACAQLFPDTPNVPRAFGWWIDQMIAWGGRVS